jgi:hypothetical protein
LEEQLPKTSVLVDEASDAPFPDTEELSSLISSPSSSSPGDIACGEEGVAKLNDDHSHHLDIRGISLLPRAKFWQLFILLGLLTGVGLMTIK